MSSQHNLILQSIDHFGPGLDLVCIEHDPEACDLRSWWANASPEELVNLRGLDLEIAVDVEWNDSAPTIIKRSGPYVWCDDHDCGMEASEEKCPIGWTVGASSACRTSSIGSEKPIVP